MKKIIFTCLIIVAGSFSVFAQKTTTPSTTADKKSEVKIEEREKFDPLRNAAEDLKASVAKAQKENKRIILDVGGEWCVWCVWMDNYFVKNPELAKLRDENFVWLKINMSEENENKEFLSKYPAIEGYPHLFVLEKDGAFLHSQGTAELEEGKSYNLQKFTDFLKKWSPAKTSEPVTSQK
jgi:thiol:disulfide interchange protein